MALNRLSKVALAAVIAATLAGCQTNASRMDAYEGSRSVDEIYEDVHNKATGKEVEILREGLRSRGGYGSFDPVTPIRMPTEIVPVWKPAYADPATGRRISGHWEHMVIKDDGWLTD